MEIYIRLPTSARTSRNICHNVRQPAPASAGGSPRTAADRRRPPPQPRPALVRCFAVPLVRWSAGPPVRKTAGPLVRWSAIATRRLGMAAGRGDGRPAAARVRRHRRPALGHGRFSVYFRQTLWQTL